MDGKILTFGQIKRYVKSAVAGAVLKGDFFAPEMHRMIFRGKNLGNALTAKQINAIDDGSFEDLWLGDYWVINNVNWRIVDIDYWLNCGNPRFTKHHLVIMPDTVLGSPKPMNNTDDTDLGYAASTMRISGMNDAKALCTEAFGANILSHREYLVNAVSSGKPSGGIWVDSTIELPSEVMVYGSPHYKVMNDGTDIPLEYTINKSQFALFAVVPRFISQNQAYWLRDIVSESNFAAVNYDGGANHYLASYNYFYIRPVFAIGKAV